MALGQANGGSLGKLERAAFLRNFGHLERFYAAALLTGRCREFDVGIIWLPKQDSNRYPFG